MSAGGTRPLDIIYNYLRQRGEPVHFKELVSVALGSPGSGDDSKAPGRAEEGGSAGSGAGTAEGASGADAARAAARIYTDMNLDVRFAHMGGGKWGLAEWAHRGSTRVISPRVLSSPAPGAARRPRPLPWPEETEEEETEPVVEQEEEGLDWEGA